MKVIIDISEQLYQNIKDLPPSSTFGLCSYERLCKVILNGKPLPKGHGRLIDADELETWAEELPSKYLEYRKMICLGDVKAAPTIIEKDGD